MRRDGFTLIEMLIVLGILGILLAIAIPSYLNWQASIQVQGAAVSLAQQIQRVRTEVKRATAAGSQPQLQLSTTSGSSTFTAGGRAVKLEGATLQTTDTLTFEAPYGTVFLASGASLPQVFTVRSTRNPNKTRTVRVVSLLGKVVVQ